MVSIALPGDRLSSSVHGALTDGRGGPGTVRRIRQWRSVPAEGTRGGRESGNESRQRGDQTAQVLGSHAVLTAVILVCNSAIALECKCPMPRLR